MDSSVVHFQKPGIQNPGRIFHNGIHKSAYPILLARRRILFGKAREPPSVSELLIIYSSKASTRQRPQRQTAKKMGH
jgi:hypothetical protein